MKEFIIEYYLRSTGSIKHARRVHAYQASEALQKLKKEFRNDTVNHHRTYQA